MVCSQRNICIQSARKDARGSHFSSSANYWKNTEEDQVNTYYGYCSRSTKCCNTGNKCFPDDVVLCDCPRKPKYPRLSCMDNRKKKTRKNDNCTCTPNPCVKDRILECERRIYVSEPLECISCGCQMNAKPYGMTMALDLNVCPNCMPKQYGSNTCLKITEISAVNRETATDEPNICSTGVSPMCSPKSCVSTKTSTNMIQKINAGVETCKFPTSKTGAQTSFANVHEKQKADNERVLQTVEEENEPSYSSMMESMYDMENDSMILNKKVSRISDLNDEEHQPMRLSKSTSFQEPVRWSVASEATQETQPLSKMLKKSRGTQNSKNASVQLSRTGVHASRQPSKINYSYAPDIELNRKKSILVPIASAILGVPEEAVMNKSSYISTKRSFAGSCSSKTPSTVSTSSVLKKTAPSETTNSRNISKKTSAIPPKSKSQKSLVLSENIPSKNTFSGFGSKRYAMIFNDFFYFGELHALRNLSCN